MSEYWKRQDTPPPSLHRHLIILAESHESSSRSEDIQQGTSTTVSEQLIGQQSSLWQNFQAKNIVGSHCSTVYRSATATHVDGKSTPRWIYDNDPGLNLPIVHQRNLLQVSEKNIEETHWIELNSNLPLKLKFHTTAIHIYCVFDMNLLTFSYEILTGTMKTSEIRPERK